MLTVKHEWGHTVQESFLGIRYIYKIAIPSVIGWALNAKKYYSQLWERSADFFGGANRGEYSRGSGKKAVIWFLLP